MHSHKAVNFRKFFIKAQVLSHEAEQVLTRHSCIIEASGVSEAFEIAVVRFRNEFDIMRHMSSLYTPEGYVHVTHIEKME